MFTMFENGKWIFNQWIFHSVKQEFNHRLNGWAELTFIDTYRLLQYTFSSFGDSTHCIHRIRMLWIHVVVDADQAEVWPHPAKDFISIQIFYVIFLIIASTAAISWWALVPQC